MALPFSFVFPPAWLAPVVDRRTNELAAYSFGLMAGLETPHVALKLPESFHAAALQKSLWFWRGFCDVRAYVAMINSPDGRTQVPSFETARSVQRPIATMLCEALIENSGVWFNSEAFDAEDLDKLDKMAERGRIATSGRLAQKIIMNLYPADAVFMLESRRAVIERVRSCVK